MPAASRSLAGLSLIESILASFLLVLVLFGLLNLYPVLSLSAHQGKQMLQADNLASSTLAELRSGPFTALVPGTVRTLSPVVLDGLRYDREVTLFLPDKSSSKRMVGAILTVRWSYRGVRRQVVRELVLHQVSFR